MIDNALTLIRAKITDCEEKLAKLKIAEHELMKLDGGSARRAITPEPAKRSEAVLPEPTSTDDAPTTIAGKIRGYLASNGPSSVRTIGLSTGLEGRSISFALQALKKRGLAKIKDGEWSMKGRRTKT